MSTITAPPQTIIYPDSDGKPMADNTLQFRWITTIKWGLDALFRRDPDVFVAGDLLWYPVEGKPKIRIAPDILVAFGRPKGERGSYMQWEEGGIAPQVVFEILSPGNRLAEMVRKFRFYQRYGVEEYYVYDPDRAPLDGWLRAGHRLKEIRKMAGFISPRLGIQFEPGEGPDSLVIIGPDRNPFLTYVQLMEQFEADAQRTEAERQRTEAERQRTEAERQRRGRAPVRRPLSREAPRAGDRARMSPTEASPMRRASLAWLFSCAALVTPPCPLVATAQAAAFRAGAAAVDIAPEHFPVIVNGGFLAARATKLNDPIRAKGLVLDDGTTRLAIVVVDSCMMPRELLDRAKAIAREKTGIPVERILISATHTHSAPSVMGALGTPPDEAYAATLPARIAAAIERAAANLEPARVGWSAVDDPDHTFCRRWIRRPDRMLDDPFGRRTVRANMHPGYQNPDAIAPSGPVNPALTVLSVQSRSGRPIAVLANYSMHYYGADPVSADYYGRFATALARRIGVERGSDSNKAPPFVAIMSQGTSGDQMWMDYGRPKKDPGLDAYADAVAASAERAYRAITYRDHTPLAMAETTLVLGRRVPDEARLAWARGIVAAMKGRDLPRTLPEVYAREAISLHDEPRRELKLQAIRVGDLGIAAIPNEVYALTGLKLKSQSPFDLTMNIELANGSEGYIPPPEQHALGGYTTWPARTAGLEVQAEPKIVAAVLKLLEHVAGKPRRALQVSKTPYADAVLASKPMAYWRLDDIEGTAAVDSSGQGRHATHEGGFALVLPGPDIPGLSAPGRIDRAVYFAGGRLEVPLDRLPETYTLELWFWNGSPEATPRTWRHLAWVRDGRKTTLYVDGDPKVDASSARSIEGFTERFIGTRAGGRAGIEGKVDEVALYDRALDAAEIAAHLRAARARSAPTASDVMLRKDENRVACPRPRRPWHRATRGPAATRPRGGPKAIPASYP